MPLDSYSVLKCRPIKGLAGSNQSPHYQIHCLDGNATHYRIAVNIHSQTNPSDLLYYADDNFQHSITSQLTELKFGLTPLKSQPGGAALDYIRGNLFDYHAMQILPGDIPGADNDLNEKLDKYVEWALKMADAEIYAFGNAWGPENKPDQYFGFTPGRGIHDIHMNQGNSGRWADDNGPWQDGGIFFHFPAVRKWVAIFLAFQSQTFHSVDGTGQPIQFQDAVSDGTVRIVAAQVNVTGPGNQTVTLANTGSHAIDLIDWAILDGLKRKQILKGMIGAGEFRTIPINGKEAQFSGQGGIISLLNQNGMKIAGVAYTKEDCRKSGCTIVF
ncbi:MAG TPA: DUF2278 family protein [Bacillota bacterium]